MLREFVKLHRDEIVDRCKEKVAARSAPSLSPEQAVSDHGVPRFLDQLIEELRGGPSGTRAITQAATRHGRELLERGFTVSQVVHDYGDVCQAVTEMVLERNARIGADDFRLLNRCLDDAIAGAVTEYGRARDEAVAGGVRENERVVALGRALRLSVYTASVAFGVIKSGKVGIAGSTGTLVERNLSDAQDLIDRLVNDAPPSADVDVVNDREVC